MKGEPVVFWGSLGLLIGLVLRYFIPDVSDQFIDLLIEVVSVAGPTLGGLVYARSKVTPVANPHDAEGTTLVPITDTMAAARNVGNGRQFEFGTETGEWHPVAQKGGDAG